MATIVKCTSSSYGVVIDFDNGRSLHVSPSGDIINLNLSYNLEDHVLGKKMSTTQECLNNARITMKVN